MSENDFSSSHASGYHNEETGDERLTREITDDVICQEAYSQWQENGRDEPLESLQDRLWEEYETKRDLSEGDPGKPAWVTSTQQIISSRTARESAEG